MTTVLDRVRQRKIGQWCLAYLAGAWLILQLAGLLADAYMWAGTLLRFLWPLLAIGFLAVVILAWYHGEKGQQRVTAPELLMLALLLLIAGTAIALMGKKHAAAPQSTAVPVPVEEAEQGSVAVLPFVDMSPKKDQEFFSDGITEEILNALAQVQGLRVAARTSSFAFKHVQMPMSEIAGKLHVRAVLEGSVQRAGNRVRITAQLIDAAKGYHLWSDRYDRDADDVFAIEDEISKAIAEALRLRLAGAAAPAAPASHDAEAHTLVLQARFLQNRGVKADLYKSISLFQHAARIDPGYADAYVGEADLWIALADDWLPPKEAYPKAREAARHALEMEPNNAGAHASLSRVSIFYDWDWAAAEREARAGLAVNPNDPSVHGTLGFVLAKRHQNDAAIAEFRKVAALDPLNASNMSFAARVLIGMGKVDYAIELLKRALEISPTHLVANRLYGDALLAKGDVDAALVAYRRGLETDSTAPRLRGAFARALARAGRAAEANVILNSLIADSRKRYVRAEEIACIYGELGNLDEAFRWLDKAVKDRSAGIAYLDSYVMYEPLRRDPRFTKLLRATNSLRPDPGFRALVK